MLCCGHQVTDAATDREITMLMPSEYVRRRNAIMSFDGDLEISVGAVLYTSRERVVAADDEDDAFGAAAIAGRYDRRSGTRGTRRESVASSSGGGALPPGSEAGVAVHASAMGMDSLEEYAVIKENRFGLNQVRLIQERIDRCAFFFNNKY